MKAVANVNGEIADAIIGDSADDQAALDKKLIDLEMVLTDLRMSGGMAGQDRLRWPRQLYAKLTSLSGYVGSSDFAPTVQQVETRDRLQGLPGDSLTRMQNIRDDDLAELNRLLN